MGSLIYFIVGVGVLCCYVRCDSDKITTDREEDLIKLMNRTVDPCDDFYEYACGNFKTIHPVPDYLGNFNMFNVFTEKNYVALTERLSENLESILNKGKLTAKEKAKLFYASCKNISAIDDRGAEPILHLLKSLGGWPVLEKNWNSSNFDWTKLVIDLKTKMNSDYLFYLGIKKDVATKTNNYYPTFSIPRIIFENEQLYKERVLKTLKAFNVTDALAKETANEILDFSKDLRNLYTSKYANEKPTIVAPLFTFQVSYRKFNWKGFLDGIYQINFKSADLIISTHPDYFELLTNLIKAKGNRVVANYLLWKFVDDLLPMLSDEFRKIVSDYEQKAKGFKSPAPRERQCIDIVTDVMNTATAAIFIENRVSEKSIEKIQRMAGELKSTISESLNNNTWMTVGTKNENLDKLDSLLLDMSYFDYLHNDSAVDEEYAIANISYHKFFESYLSLKRVLSQTSARDYIHQTSGTQWPQSLVSANVYFDAFYNTYTLYPGLLQSPFYHDNFPKFLDYSGLGIIVGRQMYYSFEETRSHYSNYVPEKGYVSTWNFEDIVIFRNKAKCFKNQYDLYSVHNVSLVGRLWGEMENIADSIGLNAAYKSYDNWLKQNDLSPENQRMDKFNLTGRQLFFIGAAQILCANIRPEAIEYHKVSDPHAPGNARVIGTIMNSRDFAPTFNCPINSTMNPEKKCEML